MCKRANRAAHVPILHPKVRDSQRYFNKLKTRFGFFKNSVSQILQFDNKRNVDEFSAIFDLLLFDKNVLVELKKPFEAMRRKILVEKEVKIVNMELRSTLLGTRNIKKFIEFFFNIIIKQHTVHIIRAT